MNKKLITIVIFLSLLALGVRYMTKDGLQHLKVLEGGVFTAYQDAVGVWTIGYGHTKDVKQGDKINQDEAENLLEEEMTEYEGYINDMV